MHCRGYDFPGNLLAPADVRGCSPMLMAPDPSSDTSSCPSLRVFIACAPPARPESAGLLPSFDHARGQERRPEDQSRSDDAASRHEVAATD
jgi:hypothetical protein